MFKRVAFTMYPVTDMARARAFHEATLGLPKSKAGTTSPWAVVRDPDGNAIILHQLKREDEAA
jgi:hypothetical protein